MNNFPLLMNYPCSKCGKFGVLYDPEFRLLICERCDHVEAIEMVPLVLQGKKPSGETPPRLSE